MRRAACARRTDGYVPFRDKTAILCVQARIEIGTVLSVSKGDPIVSVVIPAYNAADLLPEAIESVLAQTYRDFEIIVVDDGSTDPTPEVMEQYAGTVNYIRKGNGGSASARNRGIREARGAYIALLDSDDVWLPRKLELQMEQFSANPGLAWSYTDWYTAEVESGKRINLGSQLEEHPSGYVLRDLLGRLFIPPSSEVIRRDVFDEVGYYDESDLHLTGEDWEFTLRVAEKYPVDYVNLPLIEWRRHENNKTKSMDLNRALKSHCAIIEKTVHRNPQKVGDLRNWALADRYTSFGRMWLNQEERGHARSLFLQAIQEVPTYWRAWIYGLSTFLPRPFLRIAGNLRALYWQVTARAEDSSVAREITSYSHRK